MILRVAPDGWTFPGFLPGQYATLGLPGSVPEKLVRRAYSIASPATATEALDFYLNLVPEGVLTPRLFALHEGDRIWLSPRAVGRFTLERLPPDADAVFVANGTGLAPYVSMLTTTAQLADGRRVALIHGARCSGDLGYRDVFEEMEKQRSGFTYLPVISRPHLEPGHWAGETGHVQDLCAPGGALDRAWGFRPRPERTHVFLCGSPRMIDSMIENLLREGFRRDTPAVPGSIHAESYWPLKIRRPV